MKCYLYDVHTGKQILRHIGFSVDPTVLRDMILESYKELEQEIEKLEIFTAEESTQLSISIEGEVIDLQAKQWCLLFTFLKQENVFFGVSEDISKNRY